jgi:hypothetical protein
VLVAPRVKEELLLYILATSQVISMVLVVERDEGDPSDGSLDPGRGEPQGGEERSPTPDPRIIERPEETAYPAVDDDKPWTLEYWCMNFDGSLTLQAARVGMVLTSQIDKSSSTPFSSISEPRTTWRNTRASWQGYEP